MFFGVSSLPPHFTLPTASEGRLKRNLVNYITPYATKFHFIRARVEVGVSRGYSLPAHTIGAPLLSTAFPIISIEETSSGLAEPYW